MNNLSKRVGVIILCLSTFSFSHDKKILQGAIKFPATVEKVPSIRIYYAGNKISCETDHVKNKVTFSLPVHQYENHLFFMVTESFTLDSEENTVKNLKIEESQPYKLYSLTFNDQAKQWTIKEVGMQAFNYKIPDSAIIICYNPEYITALEGGNEVQFPTLVIANDLLQKIGSEEKLHDLSCELLLTCLDFDAIHSSLASEINKANPRTTLVLLD